MSKRARHEAATKKALYCYFCGAEISLSGARKDAIKHIIQHLDELDPASSPIDSWMAKKEHPEDAPIFRSPIKGEQLFAVQRRGETHWWWYPAADWEARQWEYVGPLPDDQAYRQGPPDPLPPGVERRPRRVPREEIAQRVGDNVNAGFIARVARMIGDHCADHPQQAAQLLTALEYPCTEAQVDQVAVVARMVANTFLGEPRTPIDKLQVMLQVILNPFIAPVSPPHSSGTVIHRPPEPRHATYQQQSPSLSTAPLPASVGTASSPTQLGAAGAIPESDYGNLAKALGIASPAASTTAEESTTTTTTTTTTNSIGQPASPAAENATPTSDLWQDEGMQTAYAYANGFLGGLYSSFE